MATFNKFYSFVENQLLSKIDWDADTFKVMLTNTAPVNTNTVYANITQIAAGNGYTTGGNAVTITTSTATGTITVTGTKVTFTATPSAMATFQYAVLYNDTIATPSKPLIAWWDYGSPVTLANTETFTVKFNNGDPTGTIFTLS